MIGEKRKDMDYREWQLKIIEVICKDMRVSDSIKVQETLACLNGVYDIEQAEGSTPEEAWEGEYEALPEAV